MITVGKVFMNIEFPGKWSYALITWSPSNVNLILCLLTQVCDQNCEVELLICVFLEWVTDCLSDGLTLLLVNICET